MKLTLLIGAVMGLLGQSDISPSWLQGISDIGIVVVMLALFWGIAIKDPPWLVRYGELKASMAREQDALALARDAVLTSERSANVLTKAVDLDNGS